MVKNVGKLVAALAIAAVSVATTAQAQRGTQNTNTRDGLWISGGLGYGSLGCDGCGSREGAISGNFAIGGTISPRFLLGVGTAGWTKSEQDARLTVAEIDARIRFYPQTRGNFFLTGGIGAGSVTGSFGTLSNTETGFGAIVGMGYDIRVTRNYSVTPYWNAYGMKNDNTDANVGQVGIAVTWH